MSSAVSLPNYTFTGQAKSSKRSTSFVHIFSPETYNCPFWISRRESMTVENISISISTKECCQPGGRGSEGLNPQPPDLQSDAHPTEPPRLAWGYSTPKFDIELSLFIKDFQTRLCFQITPPSFRRMTIGWHNAYCFKVTVYHILIESLLLKDSSDMTSVSAKQSYSFHRIGLYLSGQLDHEMVQHILLRGESAHTFDRLITI